MHDLAATRPLKDEACEAYWQRYRATLPATHPHRAAAPDAFAFGHEPALADELAALVVQGRKRATASLAIEFTSLGEPCPRAGDLTIVRDGLGRPVALIERTDVREQPFCEVDADFAATEGEGDGSLASWQEGHREYFGEVCQRHGLVFHETQPVLCQRFRVLTA